MPYQAELRADRKNQGLYGSLNLVRLHILNQVFWRPQTASFAQKMPIFFHKRPDNPKVESLSGTRQWF